MKESLYLTTHHHQPTSSSASQAELQQQEELLHKECKERDQVIASYRKKVDERKAQAAKVERRVRDI